MSLSTDDIKVGETRKSVLVDDLKRTRIVQYA
ncbi:acyl dehydratase, partial [Streptomyces sp. WM6386]